MMRRLGFAALAGVLVAVVFAVLGYAAIEVVDLSDCSSVGFECLGRYILAEIAMVPVACVAGWPLLYWLRVRPALRVAALSPVIFGGLCWTFLTAAPQYAVAAFGLVPISYLLGAWLTARETNGRTRVVLGVLVAASYVAAAVLTYKANR